ncbi:MAG: methyltransferase domain-containing protein [Burkholderiales bacterium]|nr:methyltransferase domain-containing protein [Burkholderiales bacterium]
MPWNPQQFLCFADHRLRPAIDLLARIDHRAPQTIVDLGCGPGNVTALLAARWPQAAITGIDNSPEMLATAAKITAVLWQQADIGCWQPAEPVDIVFSNAALHWLKQHEMLFPRLARSLARGGILAVQMPYNFASPSHTTAKELVEEGPWREKLLPHFLGSPVATAEEYYRLLAPLSSALDIWQTEYLHILEGENPVAQWARGTLLVPLLAALTVRERAEFEAEYRRRIQAAYPPRVDGKTLLPYRRLFIVVKLG